ncbi:MAG TPA: cytochrome c oxidase subunit II [Steroidobacteraceae bacterium]
MKTSPLGYLDAAGMRAQHILPLTWFTLSVSIAVCLVIAVLLWVGVRRRRVPSGVDIAGIAVERGGDGLPWIRVGLLIAAVPLAATLVWTMVVLAAVARVPANPALVLDITAHQWWWDVHYSGALPPDEFETANEIHIPVGQPVLVRLHAADVIHSFWVPKLSGKTDVIPGQINQSWLETEQPGRYLGQCSEFCGYQHAHMQFEVVAQAADKFAAWRAAQLEPAAAPASAQAARGLEVVQLRCALCHQVRGTSAGAVSAPDLTHLMSRRTLAAGTLLNTPGNLAGWIQDPQDLKPGSLMPNQYLSAQQLTDVLAYLETLR